MTNRRRTDSTQTVSLFPFLAVLLCTMGALVVLLVVMARQARLRAVVEETGTSAPSAEEPASGRREPAESADPKDSADLETELAELRQHAAQLSTLRSDAQKRLTGAQLRLGNSEDHLRTLQDRVRAAYDEAEKLATLDQTRLTNRRKAEEELARLKDLVIASETELDSARDEAAKRPKSYAIVPYKGSHGTRRRPIYIECRKDAVVLLPESIRFTPHDFDEPVGPGNPLAAALRAVREYQTAHLADPTAQEAQPYPLLLIRPDGVAAYYRAREAIASWGPDFGYEMIDADWSLELPPADPNLTRVVYQAVKSARARQRLLAQAAPRRFRHGSATGGLHGGNATGGGGGFYVPSESLAEGTGDRGQGTGDSEPGTGDRGQGTGDSEPGTGERGQEQGDGQGDLSGDALPGTQYSVLGTQPSGASGMGTGEGPPSALGTQSSGASGMGTGEGPPAPVGGAGTAGTGAAEIGRYAPPVGDAAGGYGGSTDGNARRDPGNTAPPGTPRQPRAGDTANSASTAHVASPDGQSPGGSTSGVVAGGPESSGSVSPGPGGGAGGSAAAAAAVTAFSTLGQPGGSGRRTGPAARAVPIRRAINVIVRNDRLAILPEQGVGGGRIVPVNGDVDTAAGDFAAALRDRVKRWGIAGQGLYWKPILVLKPAPDGIANANRLARRLRSGGVEVQVPGSVARRVKK